MFLNKCQKTKTRCDDLPKKKTPNGNKIYEKPKPTTRKKKYQPNWLLMIMLATWDSSWI